MGKSVVKIALDSESVKKTAKILEKMHGEFRKQVQADVKDVKTKTKSIVKQNLTQGAGVDKGIYKKSIVVNNLINDPDILAYQVGSKKHYRLSHLLEDGHKKWVFRRGSGRPTYRGNIGMNLLSGKTRSIPHIKPGQDYADKAVVEMHEKAWNKATKKGE